MTENSVDVSIAELIMPYRSAAMDCPVCLGPHDEETHSATLSVRRWFRDEVTKSFRVQQLV